MKTPSDWLAKYYPEPASEAAKRSWVDALEHSIRKWTGFRPKELDKFGLAKPPGLFLAELKSLDRVAVEGRTSWMGATAGTCALCQREDITSDPEGEGCRGCPLYIVRGAPCYGPLRVGRRSPYHAFVDGSDPEPMLRLLRSARKIAKKLDKEGK